MSKNNIKFPTSGEVLSNNTLKINDALKNLHISGIKDVNFQNHTEFKRAVKSEVNSSFSNFNIKIGYGNLQDLQNVGFNYDNVLTNISDSLINILSEGIVYNNDGSFYVDLGKDSVDKMGKYVQKQVESLKGFSQNYEISSKDNEFYENTVKFLGNYLNQSVDRLASELDKNNLPINVINKNIPKSWHSKAKMIVIPAVTYFMVKGYHGNIQNFIDSAMDNARMHGNSGSLAEKLAGAGIYTDIGSWGISVIIAVGISVGLIKSSEKAYKRILDYMEKEKQEGRNPSARKRDFLIKHKNWQFTLALAAAIAGATIEGGGLLANDVKNVYAQNTAHKIGTELDTKIGNEKKITLESYKNIINLTSNNDSERVKLEEQRGSPGPVSVAKSYLTLGNQVLENETLKKNQNVFNLVSDTERKVLEIYIKNGIDRKKFPTYVDFLKYVSLEQDKLLNELSLYAYDTENPEKGIYSKLEKNKKISHYEFHQESDKYKRKVEEIQEKLTKLRKITEELSIVYTDFVKNIENLGNSMYSSKISQVEAPKLPKIDLNKSLENILNQKPELEGKNIFEYIGVYSEMHKEGYISTENFVKTWSWVTFRSVGLEGSAGFLLLSGALYRLNYRRRKGYSLEEQEKEVNEIYEKMLDSIHKTFSGEHWEKIFPGNSGINREEAEIILQKFLLEKDPSLKDWYFIREEGENLTQNKDFFGKILKISKQIVSGDLSTEREKYIEKLYQIFSKLTKQSKIGNEFEKGYIPNISYSDLNSITSQIIPENGLNKIYLLEDSYFNFLKKYFEENILQMTINREDLYEISRQNFEGYMANNIIQSSEIFESDKVKELLQKYFSEKYSEKTEKCISKIDEISKNGKIKRIDFEENVRRFLPFLDLELIGNFYKELKENIFNNEITIEEYVKIIEECSGNKEKFLNSLIDSPKEKIDFWISEVELNPQNIEDIKEKLFINFPHKYDIAKINKFIEKILEKPKNESLIKIKNFFREKILRLKFEPKVIKITKQKFLDSGKNIFYDENMNISQTVTQIGRNLEDVKTKVSLSNDTKFFKNLPEGEKKLKKQFSNLEKKYLNVKKYYPEIENEKFLENSENEDFTFEEIFKQIFSQIENFDFSKIEEINYLENKLKNFENNIFSYVYFYSLGQINILSNIYGKENFKIFEKELERLHRIGDLEDFIKIYKKAIKKEENILKNDEKKKNMEQRKEKIIEVFSNFKKIFQKNK